jgi:superfamily II RNA helicase
VPLTEPAPSLDWRQLFPFELDDFQQQAIAALEASKSVVVCAPTGSGKTLIGEYAIYRALAQGKRVFYTTPLKALSNQKLRDFRQQFGYERVGLLTGDLSLNREAPILVMTTEIFRNMLYGTRIGEVGTSLTDVEAVVLDECHYMNDQQRGTVWEESIIYCPPTIQLVALSATVANSEELTDWIDQVHGPTELIYSDYRPIPLAHSFCAANGLFPLLDETGQGLHPNFKVRLKSQPRRGRGREKAPRERPEVPSISFVISQLQQRDMLPAIYFIFSRRGCDKAVMDLQHLTLVTPTEQAALKQRIDAFTTDNPEAVRQGHVEPLLRGVAAHHAGVLPAWKQLIEELFQAGFVKAVFATETLAAGINMPARTTVISSLSKRTDTGHRPLMASEFLQMSGRAGRRGLDIQGYVVTVQSRFEGVREAAHLATAKPDPLVSQFTPSYGMVLNLLQKHTLEEAKDLVERSFGRYLSTLSLKPEQRAIAQLEAEQEQLQAQTVDVDWELLSDYEKLQGRLKEGRRLLKILQQQAEEKIASDLTLALTFAVSGTILSLKGKHVPVAEPLPAVLVAKLQGSGQFPWLTCLGMDNRWYVVSTADVVGLHAELSRISAVDHLNLPDQLQRLGHHCSGDEATQWIAERLWELSQRHALTLSTGDLATEVQEQSQQVEAMLVLLEQHPAHRWQNRKRLYRLQERFLDLRSEISERQEQITYLSRRHWEEFLKLKEILQHFGCLEGTTPTEIGEAVAALRGDNELWLGMALLSGELEDLSAAQLAAAAEALVTEVSRPDLWTRYEMPPDVEHALEGLRSLRRQLIKEQYRRNLQIPVYLELELTGLVEAWANGCDWQEVCSNTSLDEGDVVRILRRTVDFLAQLPHAPYVSDELKRKSRETIRLINRFPVQEADVLLASGDDTDFELQEPIEA